MGAVVRDNDPGSHQASRKINATADALTPSSRPTKPSFSLVVAFMETAAGSPPLSGASVSRLASPRGLTSGRPRHIAHPTFPTSPPRPERLRVPSRRAHWVAVPVPLLP